MPTPLTLPEEVLSGVELDFDYTAPEPGTAVVFPEGLLLEGMVGRSLAISWKDLLKILGNDKVQDRLSIAAQEMGE
jgi:hypothetical protein